MQNVHTDSFLQYMEFHIHRFVREKCTFQKKLFSSAGNVIIRNINDIYAFTFEYNTALQSGAFGMPVRPEMYLKAGQLNAMGLIDEIFHYICRLYRRDVRSDFFSSGYEYVKKDLQNEQLPDLDSLLMEFCTLFPSAEVYEENMTAEEWFRGTDPVSGVKNKYLAFEEFMLCKLANENPAFQPFYPLFSDEMLAAHPSYRRCWDSIRNWSSQNEVFGPEQLDLMSLLKAPVDYAPFSLKGQLDYIRTHWFTLLADLMDRLLTGNDILSEEEKAAWQGAAGGHSSGTAEAYHFEELTKEYERFSADCEWMPNVVMMAKSTLVWLDQLSKKYGRSITRLDQIPDEELDFLADAGFNALWLIGIWERSRGSARIKQICGNQEAAASAYSLMDYEIADEIGGWHAVDDLRRRAQARGIRLAADMVPNHTGLDAKWVVENPDVFMQTRDCPFPSYNFDGENLSHDPRVGVYLENHYYSKTDCAVVFKRVDHHTGDVRYIYHGNDGTGLPWNDTAQVDFLNPAAREAVIQKILHVARNFPIIRFDAAMVLAKKHIRRLWYPEPGHGGDIASRSRYALSTAEFQERIPEEFWRQVVDRCATEAPDTLLLAEAFWMMEGYFVRTLGMHRVYNSAFMNMLKREENGKYRLTIKNTLAFDPQILKRYVNFMNNPDEETAVAQFGRDDKYFGVCTMLAAMPGLPMFGHGQIEGFEEKYGMEYRRAYYNEQVNHGLVDRHRSEIFPLLRQRRLFSGVENFLLYDFWEGKKVNENVFAWSNTYGNARSLILYNNKYEQTAGWIKLSAAYAVKDTNGEKLLIRRTLAEGLQLTASSNYFTLLQEQRSKLWYIRENRGLAESGLFAALNGFETQVFLNIYEVADTPDGQYHKLCETLNGRGIQDVAMGINEIRFKKLYAALTECLSQTYSDGILSIRQMSTTADTETVKEKIQAHISASEPAIHVFFIELHAAFCVYLKENARGTLPAAAPSPVKKLCRLYRSRLYRLLFCASGLCAHETEALPGTADDGLDSFMQNIFGSEEQLLASAAAVLLFAVEDLLAHYKWDAGVSTFFALWKLDEKAVSILNTQGYAIKPVQNKIDAVKYLCYVRYARGPKAVRRTGIIHRMAADPGVITRIGIHEWNNIAWFNREAAELLADDVAELLFLAAGQPVSRAGSPEKTQTDAARFYKIAQEFFAAIHKSEYQVNNFLQIFAGKAK